MFAPYAAALAPVAIGLLLAAALRFRERNPGSAMAPIVRALALIAGCIGIGVVALHRAWRAWPFFGPPTVSFETMLSIANAGYALPLVLGVLILLALVPNPRQPQRAAADLTPRTALTFARAWWIIGCAAVAVVTVVVTVIAGLASEPDENGNYTAYSVKVGNGSAGTTIYGWYYSIPCLVLLALIVLIASVVVVVTSRAPIGTDRDLEWSTRRLRARNVIAAASGALLLHLGTVLSSLSGTASLQAGLSTGRAGWVEIGTPFAVLEQALRVSGFVLGSVGFALWWLIVLSVIPLRRSCAVPERSTTTIQAS